MANTRKERTRKTRIPLMDSSLTVKLPAKLHEKAVKKSEDTGVTIAWVVRKALEEWVQAK
jgi:hypothetical protein